MNDERFHLLERAFALVVGAMDFATGAGLVLWPGRTLGLMGVTSPGAAALEYLRFAGVFVGCVGASYLLALARGSRVALREVFCVTFVFRAAAATFVAVAVARGNWESRWLAVTATDASVAAVQLWLLGRGRRTT